MAASRFCCSGRNATILASAIVGVVYLYIFFVSFGLLNSYSPWEGRLDQEHHWLYVLTKFVGKLPRDACCFDNRQD